MKRKSLTFFTLYFLSIIFLLTEGSAVSFAQTYPVQLTTQLIPPYSGYLMDYADPASEKLRIVLQFNDFTVPQYNIRLRLEIKGNGFSMQTKQIFNPPPIVVQPGVPVLISSTDLAPYLNSSNLDFTGINQSQYEQGKALPEGYYSICVTAFDYYLSNTQVSNEGCAQAWFTMSDPPFLNLPFCNTTLIPQTPQNILFQWTPMNMGSPNSAFNTEYDFELWEIKPDSTANPDQVVLSTPPIFKITTQQTLVNYGIAEPELTLYQKYAWRVRARDLNGYDLFKNKGYSQVCTFNYGSPSAALNSAYALTLTAQGVTHRMGMCQWNLQSVFSKYLLQVRKAGTTNWFDYRTNLNAEKVTNLEPNTGYEARVRGEGNDIPIGEWSNTATFTTLKDPSFLCDDQTLPIDPLQAVPLPAIKAKAGLIIQSGQFEVTAKEISSSGGPGWYKGKGTAKVLGGYPLAVKWSNIYIDDNNRHQQGVIEALTKGINSWVHQWDIQQAEENAIYVNGIIDSVYVSGTQVCVVLQGNATALCYPIPPDANVLVIRDEDGNQYTITTNPPPPKIEGPEPYLEPSNDVLDASDSVQVIFSASPAQKYGFNKKEYAAHGPDHELIIIYGNYKYFVPHKSLGENQNDEVLADVIIKDFDKNLLSFKTKKGDPLSHSAGSTDLQFKVTVSSTESVYAWYNGKKIGKLNVQDYKPLSKKLVLVSVNSASLPSTSALNDIYKQANISWTVSTVSGFSFDLGSDGLLESPDATLMSKYSEEMRSLRDAYRQKDTAYDKIAYYVFVVPGFSASGMNGYMVRGRAVGFVTSGSSEKDLAHELAHGAFGLEHTFEQIPKGTSNNLMDYSSGTTLTKKQWDLAQSKMPVFNWLDSEEDGAIIDSRVYVLETLHLIRSAHQNNETVSKSKLPSPKNAVSVFNAILNKVKYPFIQLEIINATQTTMTPKGKITKVSATNMWNETLYGLDVDTKVRIYVPQQLVDSMFAFLTSPGDRNILLFVGGYIPNQEITKISPDMVYQSDVWDYWGDVGQSFINTITTYNNIYASGNDYIWTSNHYTHAGVALSLASMLSLKPFLNTYPKNVLGFERRVNNGKDAGQDMLLKLYNGTIPCRKSVVGGKLQIIDTIDVVAHSMGFAYSLGIIKELQKANIHVGRFYIIAPENAGAGEIPSNLEQAWQYGSNEEVDFIQLQDGIAPQCPIPGIDGMGKNSGRVYIPNGVFKNFVSCHLTSNYGWIFTTLKGKPGDVKKR